jgi:hypothetical protein
MFAIVKRDDQLPPPGYPTKTAKQKNRKTAKQKNTKTAKQQNSKTAYAFPTIRLFAALLSAKQVAKVRLRKKLLFNLFLLVFNSM